MNILAPSGVTVFFDSPPARPFHDRCAPLHLVWSYSYTFRRVILDFILTIGRKAS